MGAGRWAQGDGRRAMGAIRRTQGAGLPQTGAHFFSFIIFFGWWWWLSLLLSLSKSDEIRRNPAQLRLLKAATISAMPLLQKT